MQEFGFFGRKFLSVLLIAQSETQKVLLKADTAKVKLYALDLVFKDFTASM